MDTQERMTVVQHRIHERLAEAQREQLIHAARAARPAPIAFESRTASMGETIVRLFDAIRHTRHADTRPPHVNSHAHRPAGA